MKSSKTTVADDYFKCVLPCFGATRWRSRLRHCATSRKTVGSIPDSVTGIFRWQNPSGRTMFLGSPQPLTEMSTMGDKGGRCVGLTTLPPSCADCHEIWEPEPPGSLRACTGIDLHLPDDGSVRFEAGRSLMFLNVPLWNKWQLFAFVGWNCGHWTVTHGMNNTTA